MRISARACSAAVAAMLLLSPLATDARRYIEVERAPPPRPGYIWAPGYWRWQGNRHVWTDGRWLRERPGYRWVPDRWEPHGRMYRLVQGHWERA